MTLDRTVIDVVGWTATAVFVGSYLLKRTELLVRVQIVGALLWLGYGVLMRAPPVVVANLLVAGAAAWKATEATRARRVAAASVRTTRAAGSSEA